MSYDVFGDLQEWGRVLVEVRKMRREGNLDEHQPGLIRLAGYPFNWQVRQTALRAIVELKRPNEKVLQAAVRILRDDNNDLDTRILAGAAVSSILSHGDGTIGHRARCEALDAIVAVLAEPQPPALHEFARKWPRSVPPIPKENAATK